MLRSIYWEIRMELSGAARYRFGIISDILVYLVLMIFFIFSNTGQTYGSVYQYTDYTELTLIGYIAWVYASAAIISTAQTAENELRQGTFHRKWTSGYPLQWLLLGRVTASLLLRSTVVLSLIAAAYFVAQIRISVNMTLVYAILISTIGMYGMGLIIAGLTLFYKKIGAILSLVQMVLLFVTDTIPTSEALKKITGIYLGAVSGSNGFINPAVTVSFTFQAFLNLSTDAQGALCVIRSIILDIQ
ncbi:MAG: ABC transporter permease [Lachnospiraceae bacterium]|nr:ABC transporter permease [Lachnospiraceae bacterium]